MAIGYGEASKISPNSHPLDLMWSTGLPAGNFKSGSGGKYNVPGMGPAGGSSRATNVVSNGTSAARFGPGLGNRLDAGGVGTGTGAGAGTGGLTFKPGGGIGSSGTGGLIYKPNTPAAAPTSTPTPTPAPAATTAAPQASWLQAWQDRMRGGANIPQGSPKWKSLMSSALSR